MARKTPHRAELDELQAELASPASGRPGSADASDAGDAGPDLAALLRELQDKLSEAAEDVEGIVVSHPLAAVAVALLVGIVIGRAVTRG
jgi:ElaB/YqjD/DUF883 family membrane-anchored ribosome-binding protein